MGIDAIRSSTNQNQELNQQEIKTVRDLVGRCAYFPLMDYHNIRIFSEHSYKNGSATLDDLSKDISVRLCFVLLMFDNVIVHCSDPLRSEVVYRILEEHKTLIESGNILFVFSNSINDIKCDYENYINNKRIMYRQNEFSATDVDSLNQKHMTKEYYEKVIQLLMKTPFLVKKGYDGSNTFKELIMEDLDNNVEDAVLGKKSYMRSHIRFLNLSLYQLLNIKYVDGKKIVSIFDEEKVDRFISTWESETNGGAPFSRHTIVEQLRQEFVGHTDQTVENTQKKIIDVIETRLSYLYSKLNCDAHQIVDFNLTTEANSIYSVAVFKKYVAEIAGNFNIILTADIVRKIRESQEWDGFRNTFLACMADFISRYSIDKKMFYKNKTVSTILKEYDIKNRFPEIKEILLHKKG